MAKLLIQELVRDFTEDFLDYKDSVNSLTELFMTTELLHLLLA
jgi:hypothetical protein